MADVSKIKLPSGTTYNIKDENALPLTGGSVTGPVSFGDSVSIDEATVGDLVVNGSASFTNGAHGVIDKAKAADVTSTLNALVKYEDTEGTFSDSNIYNTSNNLIIGSTSVPGNIQIGAKNDNYGILPNTNNYNQIGSSSLYWYRAYINNYYGLNSHVTNWDAGKNIGTASTSSAAATLGSVYFYNACAAGGTQTKTLLSNGSAASNITVTLPSATGTLALTSQIPDVSGKANKATTLAGYGITNAYTKTEVDNLFDELPEPMIFKGSVGTGGTVTSLPTATTDNEGWTYKVITALSSPAAKVGDTVISNGSSWVVIPSGDEPSGTVTSVGISNGGGLSVSGSPITSSGTITISHADTSSQASSSNSGRTYIQSLTLDTYGHVTGISTATETVTDTNTWRTIQVNGTDVLGSGTGTGKLNLKAGTNVSLSNSSGSITINATDTTYESKAAVSGGTAVSLVTTGEKYTWNSKTSNTGTITSVKTTAGTHTTINVSSGAVSFNVPTKTSHLTNDSGFLTSHQDISGKVNKSGDTMTGNLIVPTERIANTYYGISFGRTNETPVETILYTGIKWVSGSHMPVVHITGYAYGLHSPVEFKIGFYIYGGNIGYCGVTNMGSWAPDVYLFKYARDGVDYVAVGLAGSCYFLQLSADVQDEMGKFNNIITNSSAWSWSFLTTAGTIPTPDNGVTCIKVPYMADILNPTKVNNHTVNADVPANAKFTDTVPTATKSKVTGITASTTATKTTLGTAFTIPNVTSAGSASTWAFEEISIPNVTSAGSASTWAFEDIACDDITSWSAGSGSASISGAVDANDSTQLNITISHTHTAPTLQYTARIVSSKKSGANSTAPTLGTAIKVQSKKSGANGSAPTLGTAFTVPNVTGNTSATVSVTDPGHTHSI